MKRMLLVPAIAFLILCSSSFAIMGDVIDPQISIQWDSEGQENDGMWKMAYGHGHQNRQQVGEFQWNIKEVGSLDKCDIDIDFTYDEDPFVIAGISVTNTMAYDQTFTMTFMAPVNPSIELGTIYGGSTSGSFTTDATEGTLATVDGTPFYAGMIDGATVLTIYDVGSWSAPEWSSAIIDPVNIPVENLGPEAQNSITMEFKFTLTPGEFATINGNFVVLPDPNIPEPATLLLLGLGGLLLRVKR